MFVLLLFHRLQHIDKPPTETLLVWHVTSDIGIFKRHITSEANHVSQVCNSEVMRIARRLTQLLPRYKQMTTN